MRFVSTRGSADPVGFTDALLAGLAPDGGLYVPEAWPQLSHQRLAAFAHAPYAEVAAEVLSIFAGDDLSPEAARADAAAAYARFAHAAVTPLRQLAPDRWLLELFHGPTLAFKDVAMQLLARLYDRVLSARNERLTLVAATSGDTGGAAVDAFAGSDRVRLIVLYPEGRISPVQRRFMTASGADNVACLAVEGTFDDCQALVKRLFADRELRREAPLSGVNSINWARILAQSVYYLTSAAQLGAPARPIGFVVPTGNFGDAFAGYVAMRMGLPVSKLTVATNANDILARAFATGTYARGAVRATQSPAMDIQVASNFERLYFEAVGRDAAETKRAFEGFQASGSLVIPSQARAMLAPLFEGRAVSEDQTTAAMAAALRACGELVDPHTAVALAAAPEADGPTVVLATAHPAKFPEAVKAATGRVPALPPHLGDLFARPERILPMAADYAALSAFVRAFAAA